METSIRFVDGRIERVHSAMRPNKKFSITYTNGYDQTLDLGACSKWPEETRRVERARYNRILDDHAVRPIVGAGFVRFRNVDGGSKRLMTSGSH
jgi:hypothetical protein